jgi:hypothetical protein
MYSVLFLLFSTLKCMEKLSKQQNRKLRSQIGVDDSMTAGEVDAVSLRVLDTVEVVVPRLLGALHILGGHLQKFGT